MRPDINNLPNPFSLDQLAQQSRPQHSLRDAGKALAVITIIFVSLVAASTQYRRYRIDRLSSDFASLSSGEKLQKLSRLAEYDADGIEGLVGALFDDDLQVAQRAHDLLRTAQQSWTVHDCASATENQLKLVTAIREHAGDSGQPSTSLADDLLQHVLQTAVDQPDAATRQLYFAATATMQHLSVQTDQSAAGSGTADVKHQPLPVGHLADGIDWTDWPPREDQEHARPTAATVVHASYQNAQPIEADDELDSLLGDSLQVVPVNEVVLLRDIHQERTINVSQTQALTAADPQPTKIEPAAHVIDPRLQAAGVGSVIAHLGGAESELRGQATAELMRRGFSEQQVSIARTIASGDRQEKLGLVASLSQATESDVRPWLVMLLRDESREVKLHAVSALAEFKDPWVKQELRLRMVDEADQTVAFRIRRALNLR